MPRIGAALVAVASLASAHELFLHPRGFHVAPHATITLPVLNGTFAASENAIERTRITDLSLRGPGGRTPIDRATWTERDPRSTVRVTVAGPGTYVVGVEIGARTIALDGPAFDRYLAEEGITPILDRRRATGRLGQPARESYAKAAKTLIAVTDAAGHLAAPARDGASAALVASGYAAEIVPLVDPYTVGVGATIPVRALVGGRALAGWTIRAGGTIGTSTDGHPDAGPHDRPRRPRRRPPHPRRALVRRVRPHGRRPARRVRRLRLPLGHPDVRRPPTLSRSTPNYQRPTGSPTCHRRSRLADGPRAGLGIGSWQSSEPLDTLSGRC